MFTRRRSPGAAVRPRLTTAALALAAAGLSAVAGCKTGEVTSNAASPHAAASGPLRSEAVSTAQVAVGPPVVLVENGVMHISGNVHRQPGASGTIDGRIDVDLIGPDGLKLDKALHCPMQPNMLPAEPNAVASYTCLPFGYVPPTGSVLRAHFVDRQAAIRENLEDGVLDVNGNGGHTGNDVPRGLENGSAPANPTGGGGL